MHHSTNMLPFWPHPIQLWQVRAKWLVWRSPQPNFNEGPDNTIDTSRKCYYLMNWYFGNSLKCDGYGTRLWPNEFMNASLVRMPATPCPPTSVDSVPHPAEQAVAIRKQPNQMSYWVGNVSQKPDDGTDRWAGSRSIRVASPVINICLWLP